MLLRISFILTCCTFSLTTFGQAPVISSFSPTSGPIGTSVTITGTGFNATPSLNNVMFGATRATVTAASATSLTVTVPIGATYERFWVTNLVTNLTGYSVKPFTVTQPGGLTYLPPQVFNMSAKPGNLAMGDFDNDGKSDLAVTNDMSMSILRNNGMPGAISFEDPLEVGNGISYYPLGIGDLDGDGKPDMVAQDVDRVLMRYFLNTTTTGGGITFSSSSGTANATCYSVTICDLDGDGRPDYAGSFGNSGFFIYHNESSPGSIIFGAPQKIRPNNNSDGILRLTIGDLDGDSKPDLVAVNINSNVLHVYRNTSTAGSITFAPKIDFPLLANSDTPHIFIGDLDGDDKPDLAVSNMYLNNISIYRNTSTAGSISFDASIELSVNGIARSITEGDLDGDGKVDLIVPQLTHGNGRKVAILRNISTIGAMNFEAPLILTGVPTPLFAAVGDLDGDAKPDIAVSSGYESSSTATVAIFRQYTPVVVTSFSPSSGCAGTGTVVITGSGFTFTNRVTIGGTDVQSFTVDSPTQITATVGNGTSGVIEVTADNTGTSAGTFTVNNIPAQPAAISGDASICVGDTKTYSIAAVSGATSYTWTLPSGWTGTSTTNSINVTANATGGNFSVTASNTCGTSASRTLAVAVNSIPAQPGTISGDDVLCAGDNRTYNITTVSGATNYTWTLPSGWTGTSTTNSVNIITNATSGNISVTANNICGSSPAKTLAVTVNSIPAQPAAISGDGIVCVADSKIYNIAAVSGATSYSWTLPLGWTGTSTTNSINTTASITSGNVSVTASNTCGSSPAKTLAVTVNSIPAQPAAISGDGIVCVADSKIYNIAAVSGATSYSWTLPSGWTGTSVTNSINTTASTASGNISVTANNTCGSSPTQTLAVTARGIPAQPGIISGESTLCTNDSKTYSIVSVTGAEGYDWTLPSGWTGTSTTNSVNINASAISGNVSVTAINTCGASPAQTLAVTVTSVPSQPAAIGGDEIICIADSKIYNIAAVSGATSYSWTLPSGWTGTSVNNAINTTASTASGNVSVTANNTCGSSPAQTLAVTVNSTPAQPGPIGGDATLCANDSKAYGVASTSNVTSYTWTLPSGWTGTSNTNSITITAGATSGNISVIASNACGLSPARIQMITVNKIPTQPGAITGETTLCSGDSETYTIAPVTAATGYAWTFPADWAGQSTTNALTIEVIAASGEISVKASNACGSSPEQKLFVNVISVSQPVITLHESNEGYTLTSDSGSGNQWFINGEIISEANGQEYFTTTPGVYTVRIVTEGCSSDASSEVEINTRIWLAFLPNLFTPNGNGMNERFRVRAAGVEQIQFGIYDISGNEVFHTNDVMQATEAGWDGKFRGNDMPAGTYTWTLSGRYMNGEPLTTSKNQYGQVMLVR